MKIKLLFFALIVGLGVKAQNVTIKYEGGGLTTQPQKVGKGDVTTNSCWGNGDLSKKTVKGVLSIAKSNGCTATAGYKASVNGKIAVIDLAKPGECGNAYRAKVAQDSGAIAVVIVNSRTIREQFVYDSTYYKDVAKYPDSWIMENVDGYVYFSAGAQAVPQSSTASCISRPGYSVTIPVVQITKENADLLIPMLIAGQQISASIGFNAFNYDIAIEPVVVGPLYKTRPLSLAKANMIHDTLGMVVYNKGLKNMNYVLGVVDVRKQGGSSLFADTVYVDSIEAFGVDKRDTLYFTFQNQFVNKSDLEKGTYDIKYSLLTLKSKTTLDTVLLDQVLENNSVTLSFDISDSINSAGYLTSYKTIKSTVTPNDTVAYVNQPSWNGGLYAGPIKEAYKVCTVFENDHAKGLQISGVDFLAYSFDATDVRNYLLGKKFNIEVAQWDPSVSNIFDANFGIKTDDIISLYSGQFTFDKKYKSHYGNFNLAENDVVLENGTKYLVCVSTSDTLIGFGFDNSYSNKWTSYYNNRLISPIYVDGKYYSTGFGLDKIPAISLRLKEVKSTEKDILTFSADNVNATINGDKITVKLPYDSQADLKNLVATFTNSEKSTVFVGTVAQESGVTANDFSNVVEYVVVAQDGSKKSYFVTITKEVNTTSLTDVVTDRVRVLPNPSTGKFNVVANSGSLEVKVTDMAGRVVYNYANKNHAKTNHSFDISDLESGVYVARIVNNGETSVVKLQLTK